MAAAESHQGMPAVQAEVTLEIDGVTKRFGKNVALDDVSMTVRRGEVRGVIGRNGAGKSTLMGIASGLLSPDRGHVMVAGHDAMSLSRQGYRDLVGMVHQHSTLVRSMTIAENLVIGRKPPQRAGLVNWRKLNRTTQDLLDEWGADLQADILVDELTLAERQLVEIIRELARGVELVILDEPTSRLEKQGISELFANINRLRERGKSVIYISHHLAEIHELCDSVTVLRDGVVVATRDVAETTEAALVNDMIGLENQGHVAQLQPRAVPATNPVLLKLENVSGVALEPIDLEVRAGECVGVAGLIGSGKEELGLILGGLANPSGGSIYVDGNALSPSVESALRIGIGFLHPDRHESGLVLPMDLKENITMTIWDELQSLLGMLRDSKVSRRASELAYNTGVTTIGDHNQPVETLSGGNQQKVAIGRAMARQPKVLVLMNPTTGVDVASKRTIYDLIQEQLSRGLAVILISDEPDEYSICNRTLALFRGQVIQELDDAMKESELVAAIEGVGAHDEHS